MKPAREAFVQGFEITAIVSVIIVTGLAILVGVMLRIVGTDAEQPEAEEREGALPGIAQASRLAVVETHWTQPLDKIDGCLGEA